MIADDLRRLASSSKLVERDAAASYAMAVRLAVIDHARWRAAERFPGFLTETIEDEVRAALAAGRVTPDRGSVGLSAGSDPSCLYVWTTSGERIYAIRVDHFDEDQFVVMTTMKRKERR